MTYFTWLFNSEYYFKLNKEHMTIFTALVSCKIYRQLTIQKQTIWRSKEECHSHLTITTVKVVQVLQVKLTITSQQETNVWKKADKRSFPSPPEKNLERLRLQDYLLLKTLLFLLRTKQDMAEFLPKNRHLFSGLIFNYSFQQCSQLRGSHNFIYSPQCKYMNFIYLKSSFITWMVYLDPTH